MTHTIVNQLEEWIQSQAAKAPADSNLFYIEYNEALGGIMIHLFASSDLHNFDHENPDDLEKLNDYDWESSPLFIPSNEDAVNSAFEKIQKRNHPWAFKRNFYFSKHDTDDVRPLYSSRHQGSKHVFYELHQASIGNDISSYRVGDLDEQPLIDHNRIVQNLNLCDYALILQRRPKMTDLLNFYRGWMICSDRVVELVSKFTKNIQAFDARLFRDVKETEPVSGYNILNIYEKVDCIAEPYILPPPWDDSPTTFNPSKGYKLVRS